MPCLSPSQYAYFFTISSSVSVSGFLFLLCSYFGFSLFLFFSPPGYFIVFYIKPVRPAHTRKFINPHNAKRKGRETVSEGKPAR